MFLECVETAWLGRPVRAALDLPFEVWGVIGLYVAASAASARLFLDRNSRASAHERRAAYFWGIATALLVSLIALRLLGAQSLIQSAARCAALDEGWYSSRRPVQAIVIALLAVAGATLGGFALLRRADRGERLAAAGLVGTVSFVAARAVSLHHVDWYLSHKILGVHWHAIGEAAGLVLILAGGVSNARAIDPLAPSCNTAARPPGITGNDRHHA